MKHIREICRLAARTFFGKELELRVKIFHVLAIAGVLICIAMTILAFSTDMHVSALINMTAGVFSLILLLYSVRGGRQKICHAGTVIVIFLILFPSLFLFGGGYRSGMVFFFVFAVVYTVYMLDGRTMIAFTVFELLVYTALFVYAYLFPGDVHPLGSELDVLIDTTAGFLVVSISLGITMYVQFRMYQQQQKELEKARADAESANRAKSAFLANMSHEIRTPIHVIMSVNEAMRQETPDPKIREYAEKIRSAGEVLRSLVDNVLDMARIEAGRTELHNAVYRTADLLNVLELTGQTRCNAKNLRFTCISRNLPPYLYGDLSHIQRIGINLLSNAAKYTETGSVTLTVSCTRGDEANKTLLSIAVIDTGVGIKEEDIPRLFDVFTRLEPSAHRAIKGTGLGLAIVKELCRLMDGTVRVESRYRWGSTFTVELPQQIPDPDTVPDADSSLSFIAPGGRVLAVDDSRENLQALRALLSRTQLQVDTASSGKEAVATVRENHYHLILLDYMMPGMDGIQTLHALQALPDFSSPVIVLTADAMAETGQMLLKAGFAAYLIKPVPWPRLEQMMMEYLPGELVTVVRADREADPQYKELELFLQPFGIDLRRAMPFFDNSLRQYIRTAAVYLRYYPQEREKLEHLQQTADPPDLLYIVHSLKGKAKNLGITALSAEAEHMEQLCREGNLPEAASLIPHLLYLYGRAAQALEQALERHKQLYKKDQEASEHHGLPE